MHRNFIPFLLAVFGYAIILLSIGSARPLFEWQIKDINSDFPSPYEVHVSPYLLTTSIGDFVNSGSYHGKVYVVKDGEVCRSEDVNFEARRSQNHKTLEEALSNVDQALYSWSGIEIYLSGLCIWLCAAAYKRPLWETLLYTVLAGFLFLFLTVLVHPFLYKIAPPSEYFGGLECYHGTVIFNVVILKTHYETLLLLLVGILCEVGGIVMIVLQVRRAILQKKEPEEIVVG
jgi:hypothetical protein